MEKTEWEKWSDLPPVPMRMNRSVRQVPPKPCSKGQLSQASEGERSRVPGPIQSPLPRAEFKTSMWSQGSKYDSVPPARFPHLLQLPPPPHTPEPGPGIRAAQLTAVGAADTCSGWAGPTVAGKPECSAPQFPGSDVHAAAHLLRESPWPRQQVYCKVTVS